MKVQQTIIDSQEETILALAVSVILLLIESIPTLIRTSLQLAKIMQNHVEHQLLRSQPLNQ